ncbi:MAG: phosphatidylserine decarboxylase family protein [Cyclobacteriaceae bacterium]
MTIHREGRSLLFGLLILLSAVCYGIHYWVGEGLYLNIHILISVIFYLIVLQFFRNPSIAVQKNEKHILAPADGKVVVIEETTEEEHLKDRRIQVSIFMSPFNVHVNRMPAGGIISYFKYHPGKYLVAWHPKSSTENERTTVSVKMSNGDQVLFRQIAGALARRICWYIKEGSVMEQGQEFGFIKFGSRVDIFLPLNATVQVKNGQKTKGGQTIIATLP